MANKVLSADDIFAVADVHVEEVEIPEWGGSVFVRSMTGEEASKFSEMVAKDKTDAMTKAIVLVTVKEDGISPLFTEDAVSRLRKKSLSALMKLQNRIIKMNGLRDEDVKATKNG